jgi:hypothetical protein
LEEQKEEADRKAKVAKTPQAKAAGLLNLSVWTERQ